MDTRPTEHDTPEAVLDAAEVDNPDAPPGRIDDDDHANYALRKLRKAVAETIAVRASAQRKIDELEDWRDRRLRPLQNEIEFREGQLADYHRRKLEDDPDCKTIDLPEGALKSRTVKPTVTVEDPYALARWAADHQPDYPDDLVSWEPKPSVRTLRKYFVAAGEHAVDPDVGEPIPGLGVKPGKTTFSVKVAGR